MTIRPFEDRDAAALAGLSAFGSRGEGDFVLNPLWESEAELYAEFERHGTDPHTHMVVADPGAGEPVGLVGFLCAPGDSQAGLLCPIVQREERGHGVGGELLRGAIDLGESLGIRLATAAIGTRNRAGYSLLTAHGFRPMRQVFVMRCDARPVAAAITIDGLEAGSADTQDAEAILAVYDTCNFPPRSLDEMKRRLTDGRHDHLVARASDGSIAGFVELETHWPKRPWVAFVGVSGDVRDRGLGSSLMATAVAAAFDRGVDSALLALSPSNRTALRAYEKVGFRRWRLLDVMERAIGPQRP